MTGACSRLEVGYYVEDFQHSPEDIDGYLLDYEYRNGNKRN